jgi:glutathione S-transferase
MRVFHREHAGRPVRVVWTLQELDEPYELTVISTRRTKARSTARAIPSSAFRAAKARTRFDEAVTAVSEALGDDDCLVAGRFSVADVLVGSTLAFTARGGFTGELPANLRDYLVRLAKRPACQRAVELTSG